MVATFISTKRNKRKLTFSMALFNDRPSSEMPDKGNIPISVILSDKGNIPSSAIL